MTNKPSCIKLLLKYYNYFKDNNTLIISKANNDYNKPSPNSDLITNKNYRYSINSLLSNEKDINHNNSFKNFDKKKGIDNKTNISNRKISNISELTQDYLIHFQTNYPYNKLENVYPPKIINIKACVYLYLLEKKKLNITIDSLILFKYIHGQFHKLNDQDYFYHQINSKIKINSNNTKINKKTNNQNKNENNISNSTTIYYYINKEKIKINVELFSKSIDRISLNISKSCSLLMLKFIILLKLRETEQTKNITDILENNKESFNDNFLSNAINTLTMDEIEKKVKIYGNGILNNDLNGYLCKKDTNRKFNNDLIISDIYNYYINNLYSPIKTDNTSNNKNLDNILISKNDLDDGILSFIMMEQKGNKCCLGLDFRFTILQYFLPIIEESKEEENKDIISIKSYIKNDTYITKLGLNLYFKCLNKDCKYNNKCFVLNVGYGNYDMFNLIKYNAYCPFCYKSKEEFFKEKSNIKNINDNNNLDLIYIGMMNSKWAYKGYLIGIKMTVVEGKGLTAMKDILYKTKEFDYLHQFKKLVLQIERYNPVNKYNPTYNINETSYYSDDYNIISEKDINNNKNNDNNKNNNSITNEIIEEKSLNKKPKFEGFITENNIETVNNDNNSSINPLKESYNLKPIIKNFQIDNEDCKDNNNEIKDLINNDKTENINNYNNTINNINDYNNNIKKINNYNYKNVDLKQTNAKNNIICNRKINISKRTYFANSKIYTQKGEGNETNNTNIDFNIIIDKTKTNCCENCFENNQTSQVCCIF